MELKRELAEAVFDTRSLPEVSVALRSQAKEASRKAVADVAAARDAQPGPNLWLSSQLKHAELQSIL